MEWIYMIFVLVVLAGPALIGWVFTFLGLVIILGLGSIYLIRQLFSAQASTTRGICEEPANLEFLEKGSEQRRKLEAHQRPFDHVI